MRQRPRHPFRQAPASLARRKVHLDAEAPALKAIAEGQFGTVEFRDAPHDGQAQAHPLHRPGAEAMEALFDFIYGLIFVYFSALTLSFAGIGAIIFKEAVIGKAWILLAIGILFNTMGDTWYYNLELFDAYDLLHPVNMFWYAGYWLVMYALIKDRKTI